METPNERFLFPFVRGFRSMELRPNGSTLFPHELQFLVSFSSLFSLEGPTLPKEGRRDHRKIFPFSQPPSLSTFSSVVLCTVRPLPSVGVPFSTTGSVTGRHGPGRSLVGPSQRSLRVICDFTVVYPVPSQRVVVYTDSRLLRYTDVHEPTCTTIGRTHESLTHCSLCG